MARVLVTGATGFIGGNLVQLLSNRNDEPTCLVRRTSLPPAIQKLGLRVAKGDITDPESLKAAVADVDVVYHVAGLTKANSRAAYRRVNEEGVRNVAEACARRTTPPVLVVVSSLSAAGPTKERRPRTDFDPIRPISKYGQSKRAGEVAAECFAKQVPITVVRPPIVLGFGDVEGLALFRNIRRFRAYAVLRRPRLFSVVHATDFAVGIVAAAERGERLSGEITSNQPAEVAATAGSRAAPGYYFVADDEQFTFVEIGRMIARAVGRPHAWTIRMPVAALWVAGAVGELIAQISRRPIYLNLDRAREISGGHWACSVEKAKRELGYASGASFEQRIQQTAEWYRDNGWLNSIDSRWPALEQ